MSKKHKIKINDFPKNQGYEVYVDEKPLHKKPNIDLKYLHHSNKCFKFVFDSQRKRRDRKTNLEFWDDFQKFLYNFSECNNISEAMKRYSSHRSGKKIGNNNTFVKGLLHSLPKDVLEYAKDELDHLHLRANGNGQSIVYGFQRDSTFFIVGIDPYHESL